MDRRFFQAAAHFTIILSFLLPLSSGAQTIAQCPAELWLPSIASQEKTVTKWTHDVGVRIVAHDANAPSIESIRGQINFLTENTGLNITPEEGSKADLLVFVVPDIAASAPGLREIVQQFFQDKAPGGRVQIDAASWQSKIERAPTKCTGLNMLRNGEIIRAVLLIQEKETSECIDVGFGELFGLINLRREARGGRDPVSKQTLASAIKSLYSDQFIAGMSERLARDKIAKICKQL